jgi:hypothetical protein
MGLDRIRRAVTTFCPGATSPSRQPPSPAKRMTPVNANSGILTESTIRKML